MNQVTVENVKAWGDNIPEFDLSRYEWSEEIVCPFKVD